MTDYQALIARLESADQTIRTLAEENAALLAANTRLRRERDDARDIVTRTGAFQNGAGTDFEAHLDRSWPMELVDPEGRLFK